MASVPDDVDVLPPVRRGDIDRLAGESEPGVMAIIDGVFFQQLAVGHRELRDALEKGWRIWGLSSMGAIRAYEMRTLGMRGLGRVYQMFEEEVDFQDDEVALLHGAEPPYTPSTEPLVHIRVALKELASQSLLSESDAEGIAAELKSMWFGERTLPLFERLVMDAVEPSVRGQVESIMKDFDRFRIKRLDLIDFLAERPWSV